MLIGVHDGETEGKAASVKHGAGAEAKGSYLETLAQSRERELWVESELSKPAPTPRVVVEVMYFFQQGHSF